MFDFVEAETISIGAFYDDVCPLRIDEDDTVCNSVKYEGIVRCNTT